MIKECDKTDSVFCISVLLLDRLIGSVAVNGGAQIRLLYLMELVVMVDVLNYLTLLLFRV